MASRDEVLFLKNNVYMHVNAANVTKKDGHIPGQLSICKKMDLHHIEWRVDDRSVNLDSRSEHDRCFVSDDRTFVDYAGNQNYDEAHSTALGNKKVQAKRKPNFTFDVRDMTSFKYSAPLDNLAYVIFILNDGSTYPALYFHNGGGKSFLKELHNIVIIKRSKRDPILYVVREHESDKLSKSFQQLDLFTESSSDIVSKFVEDPFRTTMGRFSMLTNFFRDNLLSDTPQSRPKEEMSHFAVDYFPDIEVNHQDDFEMVTQVKLPPRPEIHRDVSLNALQWESYICVDGSIRNADELKAKIFYGGVDREIRHIVWKFLLGYYSWHSTTKQQSEERKKKVDDYFRMKLQWKTIHEDQEKRFEILRERKNLIDKDVFRTDRTHKFFAGGENKNLNVLYDVLMTYCMYNFDLGYVQGMSDLLSPILVVMENEVDAFWCFTGLMERMCRNFDVDQASMLRQMKEIQMLIHCTDPSFFVYLEKNDSANCFFCFRWILIHYKREFNFDEIQRLWEIFWTDLPCKNFHLVFAVAILDTVKNTLIENNFGFNEILKHINDISQSIPLDETLQAAEGIFLQLKGHKNLPADIKAILGMTHSSLPSSKSLAGSPSHCIDQLSTSIS